MQAPHPSPAGYIEGVDQDLSKKKVDNNEEGELATGEADIVTDAPGDVFAEDE